MLQIFTDELDLTFRQRNGLRPIKIVIIGLRQRSTKMVGLQLCMAAIKQTPITFKLTPTMRPINNFGTKNCTVL